jgi:3-methyladenine DNA glycosylase AlkD
MVKAKEIIAYMESLRNEEQRRILMGFFKTGPGEYGYGDEFLGLKVPQTREVVKAVGKDFPLEEVPELLMSKWHEVRLCGLLILVDKFERLATKRLTNDEKAIRGRDEILTMYLQYAERANNWDLVDLSAPKILGAWLLLPSKLGDRDYKIKVLDELAASPCLWKQRMSIVCTWKTSQMGDPSWCLRYAEIHLHHPHDLMHKAVGWMLREMGKRCSMDLLRDFLRQHAHEMPRTMLRYAIEKMSEAERKEWMGVDGRSQRIEERCSKPSISPFAGIPVPDFVDIILHDAKRSDEADFR